MAVLLAAGLLVASCSSVDAGSLVRAPDGADPAGRGSAGRGSADQTSADQASADRSSGDAPAELARAADRPEDLDEVREVGALVTPAGLVVPVLETLPDGYRVLAPCGDEALVVAGTPLYGADVVLDPGHGGPVETGAVGRNGLVESDLNLRVARRTARELTDRGYEVVLTRTGDYRVPLEVRAAVANSLGATGLVSIHHNAPTPQASSRPGTEVYTQSGSSESRRLGGLVWEEVVDALEGFTTVEWAAAADAGALRVLNSDGEDSYGMIRRPEMPAVLAELGYLSNPSEAELFATPEYVEVVSVALADAIGRWIDSDDIGSGLRTSARTFTPSGATGHDRGCVSPPLG